MFLYQIGNWTYFIGIGDKPLAFSQIIYQTSTI